MTIYKTSKVYWGVYYFSFTKCCFPVLLHLFDICTYVRLWMVFPKYISFSYLKLKTLLKYQERRSYKLCVCGAVKSAPEFSIYERMLMKHE